MIYVDLIENLFLKILFLISFRVTSPLFLASHFVVKYSLNRMIPLKLSCKLKLRRLTCIISTDRMLHIFRTPAARPRNIHIFRRLHVTHANYPTESFECQGARSRSFVLHPKMLTSAVALLFLSPHEKICNKRYRTTPSPVSFHLMLLRNCYLAFENHVM